MKLLKAFRATEVVEDPAVIDRLNSITTRTKTEASFYQAIEKAQKSERAQRPSVAAEEAPQ